MASQLVTFLNRGMSPKTFAGGHGGRRLHGYDGDGFTQLNSNLAKLLQHQRHLSILVRANTGLAQSSPELSTRALSVVTRSG